MLYVGGSYLNTQSELLTIGMNMLISNSRTFFIPISRLTDGLKESVASAYLCMRAIDEIEDHESLSPDSKIKLLRSISQILPSQDRDSEILQLFLPYRDVLPEVTLRLSDWVNLCPSSINHSITERTSVMSSGMADWVQKNWDIKTKEDLDHYTYCVAGAVGELLSDLWVWYDGTITDYTKAIAFGRGLQAVNILRNHTEDRERGVNFYPDNWQDEEMFHYARENLKLADSYILDLKPGPALDFCSIPLALAHGTLEALSTGRNKLSRDDVIEIVGKVTGQKI
jgi:farnesyl-diphosphate farnesyltransferase